MRSVRIKSPETSYISRADKLVVNTLFSTTLLTSTPFAPSTFDADDHIDLIDLLTAVNQAPVTGYGTISALRKIGIGSMEIASGVYGGVANLVYFLQFIIRQK